MPINNESSDVARQNVILNRFEEMLRLFQNSEGLSSFDAMSVLLTSVAHNIAHGMHNSAGDRAFHQALDAFVQRAKTERDEHLRGDCAGAAH